VTIDQPSLPLAFPKTFPRGQRANRVLAGDRIDAAGRKVLRKLFMEMAGHQASVLSGTDPEAAHDMRVTVRRMRAALDLFEDFLPHRATKTQVHALKQLGGLLGEVRDLEVMLAGAQAYLQSLAKTQQLAFAPLPDFLQARQSAAREPLLALLEGAEFADYLQASIRFLSEDPGTTPAPVKPGRPGRVCELVPGLIHERFGVLRTFEAQLTGLSLEQLHELRGAVKRLRYAIECFQEPLGPQARLLLACVKQVQDHLGWLNDANVAARMVQEFLQQHETGQSEQAAASRISSVPFLTYLTRMLERRDELVRTFPEVWASFDTFDFRQRLGRTLARL